MLYLHLHVWWRNMVWMTIKKVELDLDSEVDPWGCWFCSLGREKVWGVVYAGEKYLSYFFLKIEIDSHRRRKRRLDFWDRRSQDLIICFSTRPNSTLTSSASTNHMRRSLQAFLPSDDRPGTLRASCSNLDVFRVSLSPNRKGRKKEKEKRGYSAGRRRKVDHWVLAI